MPFQVPQYIDIEDKVVGPLSFRQFIYIAGGAGIAFLAYRFLPGYLSIFVIILAVGLTLALAFYRINNRPFLTMVDYATRHLFKPKLYVWHHRERVQKPKKEDTDTKAQQGIVTSRISESRLKDLSWSLDVEAPDKNNFEVRPLDSGGAFSAVSRPPRPPARG
ncbi:MAG: PrgI family protein [bacterium]|nr:PrgI family protein [bacterium]